MEHNTRGIKLEPSIPSGNVVRSRVEQLKGPPDVQLSVRANPSVDKECPFKMVTYKKKQRADVEEGECSKSVGSKKEIGNIPQGEPLRKSQARRWEISPIKSERINGGLALPSHP